MKRVHLHGKLGDRFGKTFELEISNPAEGLRALLYQVEGFHDEIAEGHYRLVRGEEEHGMEMTENEIGFQFGKCKDFHIIPVVAGAGGFRGIAKIVVGVALIAAAFYFAPAAGGLAATLGSTAVTYGNVALFGAALVLGGIAAILTPVPKVGNYGDREDQKPSFLFNGAVNVTNQGNPVPIVYGLMMVGSIVISTGIATEVI